MILAVSDNGVGFDVNLGKQGEHVGIENVRSRAELHCKNVVYQCISKPGMGTKTMVVFPNEGGL